MTPKELLIMFGIVVAAVVTTKVVEQNLPNGTGGFRFMPPKK